MNEEQLEGLNLVELLDLLHEIVVPEPVSLIPQTDGWLVLGGWLAAVVALSLIKWVSARRRNRYRREALALIDAIDPGVEGAAAEVAGVVKRTALAAFPRAAIASLYGSAWADFLTQTSGNDPEVAQTASLIAAAAYRPGIGADALIGGARQWIRVHRA